MSVQFPEFPWGLDGGTFNGQTLRNYVVAAYCYSIAGSQVYSGILPGGGSLAITAGSGMQIQVAPGFCVVASSTGSTYGGYSTGTTVAALLPIQTADATNERIDLVCVTVIDNGDATSFGMVQVITGTPAENPAPPALPGNSLSLGTVTVPAQATSIMTGNITPSNQYTVMTGGILPVPAIASAPLGYPGAYAHDLNTNRLWQNTASGPAQVQTLPFAPVQASTTTPVGAGASGQQQVQVLSVSFTSNGCDIRAMFKWPGIHANGHAPGNESGSPIQFGAVFRMDLDGREIDAAYAANWADDSTDRCPGVIDHPTSSVLGDTPAAGNHTLTVYLYPDDYAL